MYTLIIFITILSLLVLVHELGHFVTARRFGMRVYEFGMGFPPRLGGVYRDPTTKKLVWVWGRGKNTLGETVGGDERQEEFPATLYSINWLPIGGFCKIKGESGEEPVSSDSFAAKVAWQRLVVLVAGVAMNILLAGVLLAIGFSIGLPTVVTGDIDPKAVVVEAPHVVIQQVLDESPAKNSGLEAGDTIVSIAGEQVSDSSDVTRIISARGTSAVLVTVRRGQAETAVTVTPAIDAESGDETPRIGIGVADVAVIRYPWYVAIGKGFVAAATGVVTIIMTFGYIILELVRGNGLVADVSGPVGIASVVGESARLGIHYLINVTAMISLSLAAINILPIPALDGGRALFVIIEKVFRRKVALKYEQLAHTIGFLLLMVLIVVVTVRDIFGLIR